MQSFSIPYQKAIDNGMTLELLFEQLKDIVFVALGKERSHHDQESRSSRSRQIFFNPVTIINHIFDQRWPGVSKALIESAVLRSQLHFSLANNPSCIVISHRHRGSVFSSKEGIGAPI